MFGAGSAALMVAGALSLGPRVGTLSAASHLAAPSTMTATVSLQPKDDETPWGFFIENIGKANSLGKWLALIFFTVVLTALHLPLLWKYIVIAVGVLALLVPRVRRSRLVLAGLALLLVGLVPLFVAGQFNSNPLGFGFLFAFTQPLAAILMALGATSALFRRTDRRLNESVAALVAVARGSRPVWPDDPPLPEVGRVAERGSVAGPALVALLGPENDEPSAPDQWDPHVEQQAQLALCRIYGVMPQAGETVADARLSRAENRAARQFWRAKVARAKTQ